MTLGPKHWLVCYSMAKRPARTPQAWSRNVRHLLVYGNSTLRSTPARSWDPRSRSCPALEKGNTTDYWAFHSAERHAQWRAANDARFASQMQPARLLPQRLVAGSATPMFSTVRIWSDGEGSVGPYLVRVPIGNKIHGDHPRGGGWA